MTGRDIPPTIEWRRGAVRILDQRALPGRVRFVNCRDVDTLCNAIATLAIRGAPALGAAGAYGVALAAHTTRTKRQVRAGAARIARTRPTAVNLAWGVSRALTAYEKNGADAALVVGDTIANDDIANNRALGANGAALLRDGARVLTHCNTGSLACVGYGTALGVIRATAELGRRPHVIVDETRPLLQGARLTMWELEQLRIPATLITDNAAASLMARGEIDVAIVGADRIAANGDVANKIGTYAVALAARHHEIPFYVAAPTSTVDLATASGDDIVVEQRDPDEVTRIRGIAISPPGARALNPAFDITPARFVTGIVTEVGIARPPYRRSLAAQVRRVTAGESGAPSR